MINKNLAFLLKQKTRYKILQGGTRSGKTYSALIYLLLKSLSTSKLKSSVISCTVPHLKRGAYRDFKEILQIYEVPYKENKTDRIINFINGSYIEFFSADNEGKLRGLQRDIAFINEANLIDYEKFTQIDIRTKNEVILDFNPTQKFWLHDFVLNIDKNRYSVCITTYKDNPYLSKEQIAAIEDRKHDKNFWRVYGEGLLGFVRGQVFTNIQIGDFIEVGETYIGLDWGFSESETAIALVSYNDKFLYCKELLYSKGLTYNEIAEFLQKNKDYNVFCDSAEPRGIYVLRKNNINAFPCRKFNNSFQQGVKLLQNFFAIIIDRESRNLYNEFSNLVYIDGRYKGRHHLIDAVRYTLL